MKVFATASFLFYSTVSLANYNCQELDSKLMIKQSASKNVKVQLSQKTGSKIVKKMFSGKEIVKDSGSYFKVQHYKLKDSKGLEATLKISVTPIMSRVPCGGRARCSYGLHAVDISAELDYQGKVTEYDCKEEIL